MKLIQIKIVGCANLLLIVMESIDRRVVMERGKYKVNIIFNHHGLCLTKSLALGGIATISLFSWWPIKVFRPCPSYLAAGYMYRREGQTMDQVLFSEPSNKMKAKLAAMREIAVEEAAMKKESQDAGSNLSSEEEEFLNQRFNKDK